ncbi:MAG TPA: ribosome-associated translation inhibitor RaiA [Clostridia bacterium]|jgi:putative sigma-54 modulation protein|nr:ribosome-associated translation inhibitor RaiA [Clostridiales bacterium]MDD6722113.1 ribosome-associated translation inhibitor RaiA [Clostridiales bacterium]MDY5693770.1 ribosome-associated translation inhibitor RaiA [Eubacteriales bacterium]HZK45715.1 ribosome-associated translation inhibitor RaiA [Clostridia bacterium]
MIITITGKNIEVSDYLESLIQKKVGKLDKYFPEDTEAHVTLAVEKNRHIVEVTIPYAGGIIRGEETSGDMYASVDNVLSKLEKQIVKHRTKLEKSLRAGAFKAPEPVYADAFTQDELDEEPARVVKLKRFDIKPMTVDEAMLQLEMLGHSFYMFTNGETNQINVIYKRKDGNYGLIEPEE